MRIAIDAFNIGLRQGTGIATYGKQLANLLAQTGHSVLPVYGLERVSSDQRIAFAQFVQRLRLYGQSSRRDLYRWGPRFLMGLPGHFFGVARRVRQLRAIDVVEQGSFNSNLPDHESLFNACALYRVAQANAFVSRRPTFLSLPVQADLWHMTCPLPVKARGMPTVVTVHDIIPIVLPPSTQVNLAHYARMVRTSLNMADVVFSVSESTKHDVIRFFGVPEKKIHVTYQTVQLPESCLSMTQEDVRPYLLNQFGLHAGQYFLFYGAIEPKKNVARLINAYMQAKTKLPLVIVGKDAWLFDDVKHLIKAAQQADQNKDQRARRQRVIRIPFLPEADLRRVLKGARALVFPSLYEGFGLPVLEAMQMGCPVVTSNKGALPEVGGDAAHYVDPYRVESIAEAIEILSEDDAYAQELANRGLVQARRFSRKAYLERLHQGYDLALNLSL